MSINHSATLSFESKFLQRGGLVDAKRFTHRSKLRREENIRFTFARLIPARSAGIRGCAPSRMNWIFR